MNQVRSTLERAKKLHYILILEGIAVGLLAGAVVVLFRIAIDEVTAWMEMLRELASQKIILTAAFFLILCAVAMLLAFIVKMEPQTSGSGIPQVKGEMEGQIKTTWYKVLTLKFIGGVVAIGSGLSVGREGPSIQLGAMVGKGFSRLKRNLKTEEKLLMTCGAGAGLAAAFNAPLAGVVFSLEELHKNFSEEVLLSTMAAAISADFVCRYVFGLSPIFNIDAPEMLPLKYYGLVFVCGVILGAMGVLYNKSIKAAQGIYGRLANPSARILLPCMLAGIFGMFYPYVLGGGSNLVEFVAEGRFALGGLALLFLLKYFFSMASFGSGTPGGIFLPLLVMGSLIGGIFYQCVAEPFGLGSEYLVNFVIIGMVGYFAAIVRAPITGIILISEMTGSLSHLMTLSLAALAAYVTADLLRGIPIYDQLLERLLANKKAGAVSAKNDDISTKSDDVSAKGSEVFADDSAAPVKGREGKIRNRKLGKRTAADKAALKNERRKKAAAASEPDKVLVDTPVYIGSVADGKKVADLNLPKGMLIVGIKRRGIEIVPSGSTRIKGGDTMVVLCNEDEVYELEKILAEKCKRMIL